MGIRRAAFGRANKNASLETHKDPHLIAVKTVKLKYTIIIISRINVMAINVLAPKSFNGYSSVACQIADGGMVVIIVQINDCFNSTSGNRSETI